MSRDNSTQQCQEPADGVIIDLATPRPQDSKFQFPNSTAYFVKEHQGVVRIHVEPDDDDLDELGELTADEQRDLERCERVIFKNRESFYQFVLALDEIKCRQLFRGQFKSFAKYCKSVHGLGQAYAYRQAAWGRELRKNSPMGENAPANERQARKMIAAAKAKTRKTQVSQQGVAPLPAIHAEEVTEAAEELASTEDGEAEEPATAVTEPIRKIVPLEPASGESSEQDAGDDKIVPLDRPAHLATYAAMYQKCRDAYNIVSNSQKRQQCVDLIDSLSRDLRAYCEWEKDDRQEAA